MAGIPQALQEVLFERSTPGQSLTNAVDQKYPWEQPSEYTSVKDAREKIFLDLLEPNRLRSVIELMSTKVPVNTIAQVVLREGFNKGKFNPDMMLNLLEPTMFMLMALAEKAGIEPVVDSDEDDLESEEASELANESKAFIKEGGRFEDARVKNIQPMSVGKDISDRLEKLDSAKVRASLLQRPEPKDRTSLLEK
jgi:hypothetical protein